MGLGWIGLEMSNLVTCALEILFRVIVRSATFVSIDTLLELPMLARSGHSRRIQMWNECQDEEVLNGACEIRMRF